MSSIKDLKERISGLKKSLEEKAETTEKALTTRKLYIPLSASYGKLEGFDAATRGTNRAYSKIQGRDGITALQGTLVEDLSEAPRVIKSDILKSCKGCGLSHRGDECPKCADSKSPSCEQCGDNLVKQIGGGLGCSKCY